MTSQTTASQSGLTPMRIVFFATVVGIFIFNVFASQVLTASRPDENALLEALMRALRP